MNNQVEILIKLIIPAILLIFWALSNLFNREGAAVQGRGAPGARPMPRPGDRPRPVATTARPVPPKRPNEEVFVIRSETNEPPGRSNNQPPGRSNSPQKRNSNRGKGSQSSQPRRPDAPKPRHVDLFDAKIPMNVNQSVTKPLEIRPLTESVADTRIETVPSNPSMAVGLTPPSTIADLRVGLATQGRIREALLLNEILQPPMALRNRGRGHR